MQVSDYTVEYCPWCENEVVIHAHGVTACPECKKPLAPCSVCIEEGNGCFNPCPYGCLGSGVDETIVVTMPPISNEEQEFAMRNC